MLPVLNSPDALVTTEEFQWTVACSQFRMTLER